MQRQRISVDTTLLTSLLLLSLAMPVAAQTKSSAKVASKSRTEAQLKKASDALANHDPRQAFRLATELIDSSPPNASAFFIRGKARAEYDDSRNALLDLSTGMRLDPSSADPQVFLTMAQVYWQRKEPERALHALKVGNIQQPNFELYKMSAGINSSLGRNKEALLDLEKALKFDPSSRTMILLRGSLYDRTGDFEHAIKDYSHVIEISTQAKLRDTNWVEATKKRAADYEKTGNTVLARNDRDAINKEGSSWEKDLFDVAK